jgi:hypothetical protein
MSFYLVGIYSHLVCSTQMVTNIKVIFSKVQFWGKDIHVILIS